MSDTPNSLLGNAANLGETLASLSATIDARAGDDSGKSYTAQLLKKGASKIAKKIIEEGGELGLALVSEDDEAVASEAGDVLYHLLVGLRARGISLDQVASTLAARQGLSGLEEKAGRER